MIANECAAWTTRTPVQIEIKTDSGGDILATVALTLGYFFDTSSGSATYNTETGSLLLAVQPNETLSSRADTDPFSFAFCIQCINPLQSATGAKLVVGAKIGTKSVGLQSISVPGLQVSYFDAFGIDDSCIVASRRHLIFTFKENKNRSKLQPK